MNLLTPWLLAGLAVLPLLWWLLRATPPAPRVQDFPAIRLLMGLQPHRETASRTPWWLLALRLGATALLIVGLAGPVLTPARDPLREALPGTAPLVLVMDDGWTAAVDWTSRLRSADAVLQRAEQADRKAILLTTAPDGAGEPPSPSPAVPAALLRTRVAALRPQPWPADRKDVARALDSLPEADDAAYVADGIAGPDDAAFAAALTRHVRHVTLADAAAPLLMRAPTLRADRDAAGIAGGLTLHERLETLPGPARPVALLAEDRDGLVLARAQGQLAGGAAGLDLTLSLPAELRNRIARLQVAGGADAGSVRLLDEGDRRRPVGLLSAGSGDDTRLIGATFYLRRAFSGVAELREGRLDALLARQISVIVAPDGALAETLADPARRDRLRHWIAQGGMLIRFAGPHLAAATAPDAPTAPPDAPQGADTTPAEPDPFLPVALLGGTRQLGGAMSWSTPEHLAAFGADTPFAGLPVPHDVAIRRQVLAAPSGALAGLTWARLDDGTPLVTHHALGDGQVVLFHVTSTADWSDLPLSGLFPQMLTRLVRRAAGVAGGEDDAVLAPEQSLDGFGALGPPPAAARGLAGTAFLTTLASPQHPPGLYGPATRRRALNLGDALPPLRAQDVPEPVLSLSAVHAARPVGPWLVALGLLLLACDQIAVLGLRGGVRPSRMPGRVAAAIVLSGLLGTPGARAVTPDAGPVPPGALQTTLAYVETGDGPTDAISQQGLAGLSDYVNQRTSASLGRPVGVRPGRDDLSFYPLLYWPILPEAQPDPRADAALNDYMAHGGMLMIDTQGGDAGGTGSGAGFTAGAGAALRRVAAGLDVPALARLDDRHVLAHTFYLLHDFPGRFDGSAVWVAAGKAGSADEGSDAVSPVIIGGNDWAAAWAVDASGNAPYAAIPGGDRQRQMAFRFGVNAVIYALTGNYKADQVHVPALLERLGE